MQSINQLNASVKLLEVWKSLNLDDYPLKTKRQENNSEGMATRAGMAGRPIEIGKTALTQKASVSDSIYLWNRAPKCVTECKTIYQAKKKIKAFVKTLPI